METNVIDTSNITSSEALNKIIAIIHENEALKRELVFLKEKFKDYKKYENYYKGNAPAERYPNCYGCPYKGCSYVGENPCSGCENNSIISAVSNSRIDDIVVFKGVKKDETILPSF